MGISFDVTMKKILGKNPLDGSSLFVCQLSSSITNTLIPILIVLLLQNLLFCSIASDDGEIHILFVAFFIALHHHILLSLVLPRGVAIFIDVDVVAADDADGSECFGYNMS